MSSRRRGGWSRGLEEAVRAAERLIEALEARGYRVVKAYLFGSRVRGDWIKTSDVDLVIVSPDFEGLRFTERLDIIEEVQWREGITPHVEAIPLTPHELRERLESSTILRDASRYWIPLRPRGIDGSGGVRGAQTTTPPPKPSTPLSQSAGMQGGGGRGVAAWRAFIEEAREEAGGLYRVVVRLEPPVAGREVLVLEGLARRPVRVEVEERGGELILVFYDERGEGFASCPINRETGEPPWKCT